MISSEPSEMHGSFPSDDAARDEAETLPVASQ